MELVTTVNAQDGLSRRLRDRKPAANPLREKVAYFSMARNAFRAARLRILPRRMLFAFSA
jgi:hypothetical protein